MTSAISWLDFSEEDQRRAREILQLFTQPGSVDELGIGPVRDALSDAMFPGTSVLHTRARYLLFIPWLFREGERRHHDGTSLVSWVDLQERRLIEALRAGGSGGTGDGLIGRIAGTSLKHLPSAIYWHALQQFRILRHPGTIEQTAGITRRASSAETALTELAERGDNLWDLSLPKPPEGFFQMEKATFSLSGEEAEWLAERIQQGVPATVLAWLVLSDASPTTSADAPWEDPSLIQAPPELSRVVGHARIFSGVIHGAALLYNLLVAERCLELGITQTGEKTKEYEEKLDDWTKGLQDLGQPTSSWSLDEFWHLVTLVNPGIPTPTRRFINEWIALVLSSGGSDVGTNKVARQLVSTRERHLKSGRSRLTNERLILEWTGSSGADPLTFRWQQVKVLLRDISAGRKEHAGA